MATVIETARELPKRLGGVAYDTLPSGLQRQWDFYTTVLENPRGVFNLLTGKREPIAASINIAAACNLRCQHCYIMPDRQPVERFKDAAFLHRLDEFRREQPTAMLCTWVGGEPLLRKNLLRQAVTRFPFNWVVTNGTVPIDGEWPKFTAFFVSVDGPQVIHDSIRRIYKHEQNPGWSVYERAMKNACEATAPIAVHTVINQHNLRSIPEVVEEWKDRTPVKGFAFSMHTPLIDKTRPSGMSEEDEELFLPDDQRCEAMDMLLDLKAQHGDFVLLSREEILRFHPADRLRYFGSNCPSLKHVDSRDNGFSQGKPCVIEGGDCDLCGCVIPVITRGSGASRIIRQLAG